MMTYEEALKYIHSTCWLGSKPGLSRTRELLEKLDNPQKKLKFIHVAGTNGKGSFCAMISSVLTAAGYKTGLFTSPYILSFNERMKINGSDIKNERLAELTEKIMPLAEAMEDHPTEFELITCLAFQYFHEENCDIVVLETGMGGELDSTNVIENPELCVITAISLDHTAFLGDTIEKIAKAKAGIIKPGCVCLNYSNEKNADAVIENTAKMQNAFILKPQYDTIIEKEYSLKGHLFSYADMQDIYLPLLGDYQLKNAAMCISAAKILKDKGYSITENDIRSGLKNTKWPARFELLGEDPVFIVDGGHNPQGIRATASSLKSLLPGKKVNLIFGVMKDKDYEEMLKVILPYCNKVFAVTPNNPRALDSNTLCKAIRTIKTPAFAFYDINEAVKAALNEGSPILAAGSLYMSADIRNAYFKLKERKNALQ